MKNSCLKFIIVLFTGCLPLHSCGQNLPKNTEMNQTNLDETSDLLTAVEQRNVQRIEKILATQLDLEVKDQEGRTALMIATYQNDEDIAQMLIQAGADVNAQDDLLNSPFLYAGANGQVGILKMCLAHGADFNVYNRYGGSALIPAAERRHLEVVEILIATPNYPIDHINKLGWTALMEAIILGETGEVQIAIVAALVNAGADVNIPDHDGISPFKHAENRGMNEIAAILTQAGAQ